MNKIKNLTFVKTFSGYASTSSHLKQKCPLCHFVSRQEKMPVNDSESIQSKVTLQ